MPFSFDKFDEEPKKKTGFSFDKFNAEPVKSPSPTAAPRPTPRGEPLVQVTAKEFYKDVPEDYQLGQKTKLDAMHDILGQNAFTFAPPESTKQPITYKPRTTPPALLIEGERVPKVESTASLVKYVQIRDKLKNGDKESSPVAKTNQQKRRRELFDEFGGDKDQIKAKLFQLAKANKEKNPSKWALAVANEIIVGAKAQKEGTKPDTSIPAKALEGGLQTFASIGPGELELTEGLEGVGQAGQLVGEGIEFTATLATSMSIGATMMKSPSKIVKTIGGVLANPDLNPVPDAVYAAINEGDFTKQFAIGYIANIAIGRALSKDAFKILKNTSKADRASLKSGMERFFKNSQIENAQGKLGIITDTEKLRWGTVESIIDDVDGGIIDLTRKKKTASLAKRMQSIKNRPKNKPDIDELGRLQASAETELKYVRELTGDTGAEIKTLKNDIAEIKAMRQELVGEAPAVVSKPQGEKNITKKLKDYQDELKVLDDKDKLVSIDGEIKRIKKLKQGASEQMDNAGSEALRREFKADMARYDNVLTTLKVERGPLADSAAIQGKLKLKETPIQKVDVETAPLKPSERAPDTLPKPKPKEADLGFTQTQQKADFEVSLKKSFDDAYPEPVHKADPVSATSDVKVKKTDANKFDPKPVTKDERSGWRRITDDTKDWAKAFGIRDKIRGMRKSSEARIRANIDKTYANISELETMLGRNNVFQRVGLKKKDNILDPDVINALLKSPELRNKYRVDGVASHGIPTSVLNKVDEVRTSLDDLSQALGDDGNILSEALEIVVGANNGIYIKRSYKKFTQKNWWKTVSKDEKVVNDAKAWVRENYADDITRRYDEIQAKLDPEMRTEMTQKDFDKMLDAEVKALASETSTESMSSFNKWIGSVDRTNLKKRKDIPLPIRKLMGEIDDPIANSIITARNMIIQIEQSRVNREIIEEFMITGDNPVIFNQKRTGFDTAIKMDMGFGAKKTLYTSKEIAKEFSEEAGKAGLVKRELLRLNGLLKAAQTVGNPKSHIRNVKGNVYTMIGNNHWRIHKFPEAVQLLRGNNPELRTQLIADGLLGNDIITQQLADLVSARTSGLMTNPSAASVKKMQKQMDGLSSNILTKLYQAEDEVFKVYGYLNEIAKGYDHKHAIDIARTTYPNYANLPRFIEKFKHTPFIGTFVSFPTAMIQVSGRILKQTVLEASGKSGLKNAAGKAKKSYSRIFGVTAIAAYYAGRHKFNDKVNTMTGGGAPFNELGVSTSEVAAIIQKRGSPWERFSEIQPTRITESGGIEYYNRSYENPFSILSEPITALSQGDISGAAMQALQPYTDPSMLASMGIALFTGRDEMGNVIYDADSDEIYNNISKLIEFSVKRSSPWAVWIDPIQIKADLKAGTFDMGKWVPGWKKDPYIKGVGYEIAKWQKVADSKGPDGSAIAVDEYGKKYTAKQEWINLVTGSRKQELVPRRSFKYDMYSAKDSYSMAMRHYMKKQHKSSSASVIKLYKEEGEARRKDVFAYMLDSISDFKKLGLTDDQIYGSKGVLREIKISRRMAHELKTGKYVPYRPSKSQIQSIILARKNNNLDELVFDF